MRWHCPPATGLEIWALAVWGRARYLSATEAPHNTKFHTWMGKKHSCFFQTAENGNRTPHSVLTITLGPPPNLKFQWLTQFPATNEKRVFQRGGRGSRPPFPVFQGGGCGSRPPFQKLFFLNIIQNCQNCQISKSVTYHFVKSEWFSPVWSCGSNENSNELLAVEGLILFETVHIRTSQHNG